jgi:hypothetical protein
MAHLHLSVAQQDDTSQFIDQFRLQGDGFPSGSAVENGKLSVGIYILFSQKQMHFLLNLEKRKQVKLPAEN